MPVFVTGRGGFFRLCRFSFRPVRTAPLVTQRGRSRLIGGPSMSTIAAALRPIPFPSSQTLRRDPAAQAFTLLRIAFTVAPILFGLDKFANVLTNDWTRYLATEFNDIIPGTAADAMHIVGVVEIAA